MITKIFNVYDSKAEAYLTPFFMKSTGEAVRSFGDTCKDETTTLNKHPADYTLFEIGAYDDSNGLIQQLDSHINLGCAIEYIEMPPSLVKNSGEK